MADLSVSVDTWLSTVKTPLSALQPSTPPSNRISTCESPLISLKRKRSLSLFESPFSLHEQRHNPLTEESLRMSNLGAPAACNSVHDTIDDSSSAGSTSSLKVDKDLDVALRQNPLMLGQMLSSYGLKINHDCFEGCYRNFKRKIQRILDTTRSSEMRPASLKKHVGQQMFYGRTNEATVARKLFSGVLKDARVPIKDFSNSTQEPDTTTAGVREEFHERGLGLLQQEDYFSNGIADLLSPDFHRGIFMTPSPGDLKMNTVIKNMAKVAGMTNPRPDAVYGYRHDLPGLNPPDDISWSPSVLARCQIAPGLAHAVLIIETKGDGGSVATAEDQARRGGATLVKGHQDLLDMARGYRLTETRAPQEDSLVFSCTFNLQSLDLWVHWAEAGGTNDEGDQLPTLYHMNRVKTFLWNDNDHLIALRRSLHNILDWSLYGGRLDAIKNLHAQLFGIERGKCKAEMEKQVEARTKHMPSPRKTPSTPKSAESSRGKRKKG